MISFKTSSQLNHKCRFEIFSAIRFRVVILSLSIVHSPLSNLFSQPTGELKYSYLHSPELDKIVQTYNFSRPWQEEKLIPLTHGFGGTLGWNFKLLSYQQLHLVTQLGYQRFGAVAENFNVKNSLGFHRMAVSFSFRFHPRALLKGIQTCGPLGPRWFLTLTPEYSLFMPFVRTNGNLLMLDEDMPYRPITSSFALSFGTGYHAMTIKRFVITPEVSATWFPRIELDDFAEAVNGHNITSLQNDVKSVFHLNAGLRITWVRGKANWWERPREGDKE